MKPNNLIALLIVAILLAIGIALAVINKRSERADKASAHQNTNTSLITAFQEIS